MSLQVISLQRVLLFLGDYEFVQVSSVGGGPYNVTVGKIGVDESEVKVN